MVHLLFGFCPIGLDDRTHPGMTPVDLVFRGSLLIPQVIGKWTLPRARESVWGCVAFSFPKDYIPA